MSEDGSRHPRNMTGLLKFAMEHTRAEDATGESTFENMDPERKEWLEGALRDSTVDTVAVLKRNLEILKGPDEELEDGHQEALENIKDLVDNMDYANDFCKIGGFEVFPKCFNSSHASIRSSSADLLAELVQNNPYCQTAALQNQLLPLLLKMLDTDVIDNVKIKVLYAVSALARDNAPAQEQLMALDGFSVLLRVMQSKVDKLKIKASFMLSSLCSNNPAIKDTLFKMGFVEQLIALLQGEHDNSHEHILAALHALVFEHLRALVECRRPELNLQEILLRKKQYLSDKEEYKEELDYCSQLLDIAFASPIQEKNLER